MGYAINAAFRGGICSAVKVAWTGLDWCYLAKDSINGLQVVGVGACEQYRGSKYIYVVVVVVVSQVNQVKSEWRFGRTDVGCRMG